MSSEILKMHKQDGNHGYLSSALLRVQVGNHIDILTKKWVAQDAGIGAGVDSYFEYLVKGAIMLQDEELLHMFKGNAPQTRFH